MPLLLSLLFLMLSSIPVEAADSQRYVPGQVLVRMQPEAAEGVLSAQGFSIQDIVEDADIVIVATRPDQSVEDAVAELERRSDVVFAQPNFIYHGLAVIPNDAQYASQYHLVLIGCPDAWDYARGAASETIAILDSGYDSTHIDLAARIVLAPGIDIIGGDSYPVDTPPASGHGTSVIGIIGAITNNGIDCAGVDWYSNILPVRVLSGADATGTSVQIEHRNSGIQWRRHDQERDFVLYSDGRGCRRSGAWNSSGYHSGRISDSSSFYSG